MKALEKDRTRRYQTANALAADVRRHLSHEPVSAGPPSTVYRRRSSCGGTGSAWRGGDARLLLVAFGGRWRCRRNESPANAIARIVRRRGPMKKLRQPLGDGVHDRPVQGIRPERGSGNTITAREVLDRGLADIDTRLTDEPAIQARLMTTMGRVYSELALNQRAEQLHRRALALRTQLWGACDPETLQSLHSVGAELLGVKYLKPNGIHARLWKDGVPFWGLIARIR